MNYVLVRYADEKRTYQIGSPHQTGASFQKQSFSTIGAHLYYGAYFPGTRPRPAADQTRFDIALFEDRLMFDLVMEEPLMDELEEWMADHPSDEFWDTDFVSLNFITADHDVDFFCVNHFHCGDPESILGVDRAVEVSGWCGDFNRDDLAETNGHQQNIFDTFDAGMNAGVV
ncbi:MAG: hypothetical protein ACOC0A_02150, partial [Planctomycetota bacterium]